MLARRLSLLFLFAVLVAALGYFLSGRVGARTDPAILLPADTLFYMDIKKPVDGFRQFRYSRLGRNITSIRWSELLRSLNLEQDAIDRAESSLREAGSIFASPYFQEFCFNRLTLALLPGNSGQGPLANLVLLTRPRHRASLLETFADPLVTEHEVTHETYLGKDIRTYKVALGLHVSIAVSDGFFIASLSIESVRACLDRSLENMTSREQGLAGKAAFIGFRRRAQGKEDRLLYIDIAGLARQPGPGLAAMVNSLFTTPDGAPTELPLRSVSMYRRSDPGKLHYTGIIRTTMPDPESAGQAPAIPPAAITFLQRVPRDLLAFYWTNIFEPHSVVRSMGLDRKGSAARMIRDVEEHIVSRTGLNLEQFLMLFGNRMGFSISEVWTDGFLPMPKVSLRLEVKDRKKIEQTMTDLLSGQQVETIRIGGADVYIIKLAGGLIQPVYSLQGDFIILADSLRQMRKILGEEGKPLVTDPLFKSVDVGLAKPSNIVAFVRSRELVNATTELVIWAGTLWALSDPESGRHAGTVSQHILLPILDGFRMYRAGSFRLYRAGPETVVQTVLLIDEGEVLEE